MPSQTKEDMVITLAKFVCTAFGYLRVYKLAKSRTHMEYDMESVLQTHGRRQKWQTSARASCCDAAFPKSPCPRQSVGLERHWTAKVPLKFHPWKNGHYIRSTGCPQIKPPSDASNNGFFLHKRPSLRWSDVNVKQTVLQTGIVDAYQRVHIKELSCTDLCQHSTDCQNDEDWRLSQYDIL